MFKSMVMPKKCKTSETIWKMPERILTKKNTQRGQQNINMLNLMTSMHPYYVPISFSYRLSFCVLLRFFFLHI